MTRCQRLLVACLCTGLFAGPASGQGITQLFGGGPEGDWGAVGRLEFKDKAFCTGALISEALVLTAAHCLFDRDTGAPVPVEEMEFLAGWENGRAAAYRRVRRAVAHPDFDFTSATDSARVRHDLALLELQHPIRNTTITAFATDEDPEAGDDVGVVSYGRRDETAPDLQERCDVLSRQDGIIVMSCAVDFGASGAPVFSFESGTPRIVSVVSAKAQVGEDAVSLGVILGGTLDVLRDLLDAEIDQSRPPGVKTITGSGRPATAAKFLRPAEREAETGAASE